MRLRTLLLVAITLLLSACEPQGLPFEDWILLPDDDDLHGFHTPYFENNSLRGTVESVKAEQFKWTDSQWELEFASLAAYDSVGHCIVSHCRYPERVEAIYYTYDTLGRRIQTQKCTSHYPHTNADTLDTRYICTFRYSRNGRRVQASLAGDQVKPGTYRIRYNRDGQLRCYIYPDGSKVTCRYNKKGQLSQVILPDASVESYEYDSNGHLRSISQPPYTLDRPDSVRNGVPLSSYDSLGRCVEHFEYQSDEDFTCTKYRYDDHGNWIRKTVTNSQSPIVFITNRTITYYQ